MKINITFNTNWVLEVLQRTNSNKVFCVQMNLFILKKNCAPQKVCKLTCQGKYIKLRPNVLFFQFCTHQIITCLCFLTFFKQAGWTLVWLPDRVNYFYRCPVGPCTSSWKFISQKGSFFSKQFIWKFLSQMVAFPKYLSLPNINFS